MCSLVSYSQDRRNTYVPAVLSDNYPTDYVVLIYLFKQLLTEWATLGLEPTTLRPWGARGLGVQTL